MSMSILYNLPHGGVWESAEPDEAPVRHNVTKSTGAWQVPTRGRALLKRAGWLTFSEKHQCTVPGR